MTTVKSWSLEWPLDATTLTNDKSFEEPKLMQKILCLIVS